MKPHNAWLAGSTYRWHRNPHLGNSNDRVDAHSARVAVLILMMDPDASANLLKAAIIHDLGESGVGDVAYPVKLANPDLDAILDRLEKEHLKEMGLIYPNLLEREGKLLELCDKLDAYLWGLHNEPYRVMNDHRWRMNRDRLFKWADALGLRAVVETTMAGVNHGQ